MQEGAQIAGDKKNLSSRVYMKQDTGDDYDIIIIPLSMNFLYEIAK